jgi:hypothetical protein
MKAYVLPPVALAEIGVANVAYTDSQSVVREHGGES